MFSWDSIESVVKTIFPLWMYEFEWSEYNELLTSQIEVVLKRIHKPSKKGPVTLFNKIKEECENILNELKNKLTTEKAIKFFKKEIDKDKFRKAIDILELYKKKEHGRWLISSTQEILSFATKLKSLSNIFELIELQLELDKIIPYEYRHPWPHSDEEATWYAAIISSPILSARDELRQKVPLVVDMYSRENKDEDNLELNESISDLYNDLLALKAIKDIIMSNIFALTKPTKWIVNGGFFPMAFFVALGYSFVWWTFSLRNFIYAFIAVFVILVVKDLLFPKN